MITHNHTTGIGDLIASLKLTEQIITDLLCMFISISKGIPNTFKEDARGFWHLT